LECLVFGVKGDRATIQ